MSHDSQTPVLQQWMPFNRTGVSGRVSSTHQLCYCLEFFRSEKQRRNRLTSSPRLARSTMVRSDSTDAGRYTIPTAQREFTAVSAFRSRGTLPSVAVSRSYCMADIGSAYQAAGFPEEVTNVLLASWSQSTKKRYQGPRRAWSNWFLPEACAPSQHQSQMCWPSWRRWWQISH